MKFEDRVVKKSNLRGGLRSFEETFKIEENLGDLKRRVNSVVVMIKKEINH